MTEASVSVGLLLATALENSYAISPARYAPKSSQYVRACVPYRKDVSPNNRNGARLRSPFPFNDSWLRPLPLLKGQ